MTLAPLGRALSATEGDADGAGSSEGKAPAPQGIQGANRALAEAAALCEAEELASVSAEGKLLGVPEEPSVR